MLFCVIIPWQSLAEMATRTGSLLVASNKSFATCSSIERFSAAAFKLELGLQSILACFDLLVEPILLLGLTSKSFLLTEGERPRGMLLAVTSAKLGRAFSQTADDELPVGSELLAARPRTGSPPPKLAARPSIVPFYDQGSKKVNHYNFYYLQAVFFSCGLGIPVGEELHRTNH